MVFFLIIIHVVICFALVIVVLMQTGKGGLDSNFGGIATNALGSQNAGAMIKNATKILFATFVISCILLATQVKKTSTRKIRSKLSEEIQRESQSNQSIDLPIGIDPQGSSDLIEVQIPNEQQTSSPIEIILE